MKLLVTSNLQASAEELDKIRALGYEITLHGDEHEAVEAPEQYEAAIGNSLFLYQDIRRFTSLRYIQLLSVGLDRVPLDYIREHGITLKNAAGVYAGPMAEWTLMRALDLVKGSRAYQLNQNEKRWKKVREIGELDGRTALIVGFGDYGREIAKRLKAFGVRVLIANRTEKSSPYMDAYYPLARLKEALPEADLVIMAVAITGETRHLIGAEEFAAMKDGAYFINAARGGLVDESELVNALTGGKLAGAALDVFETEPLPAESPLWTLPNVFLSPHNSFIGEQNHRRMMDLVLKNLADYKA